MTLDEFARQYKHVVAKAVMDNTLNIAKGSIKDMEEYNRKVGRNEGLGAAQQLMDDMLKQLREDADGSDLPEMDND